MDSTVSEKLPQNEHVLPSFSTLYHGTEGTKAQCKKTNPTKLRQQLIHLQIQGIQPPPANNLEKRQGRVKNPGEMQPAEAASTQDMLAGGSFIRTVLHDPLDNCELEGMLGL